MGRSKRGSGPGRESAGGVLPVVADGRAVVRAANVLVKAVEQFARAVESSAAGDVAVVALPEVLEWSYSLMREGEWERAVTELEQAWLVVNEDVPVSGIGPQGAKRWQGPQCPEAILQLVARGPVVGAGYRAQLQANAEFQAAREKA